jgi:hypothetical protein
MAPPGAADTRSGSDFPARTGSVIAASLPLASGRAAKKMAAFPLIISY